MNEPLDLPKLPEGYLVMMTPDPEGTPALWFDEKDMRDYARAAVLADRASRWMPIESAPKDGTEILAWREDCGTFIASWTAPQYFLSEQQIEDEMADMEGEDREALARSMETESWFGGDSTLGGFRCESAEVPTRWMPLLAPPSEPQTQNTVHFPLGGGEVVQEDVPL